MTDPVAREPGEPVSPELVLVCPELAPSPEDDAWQRVAQTLNTEHVLRPPNLEVRETEPARRRVDLHANPPAPHGPASPDAGRDRRRDISTYGFVVIAIAAVGILGWRSLLHSTDAQQSIAPLLARTHSPSVRAPAAPASDGLPTAGDGVAPAKRSARTSHGQPATISAHKSATPKTTTRSSRAAAAKRPAAVARPSGYTRSTHERPAEAAEVEPSGLPGTRAPTGPLFAPDAGQRVVSRPQLTWDPVANVRGYRLRLYRGTRLILDAVAREPKLALAARWRFDGRRVELTPATYRWYVWPIPQTERHAAKHLLKASSFVLVRQAT